jgi:L-fuculose-phosphate aldolase
MSLEWREIARFGSKVVASGLSTSRFGNISLKIGDSIFITCTGSMLDELDARRVVQVNLQGPRDLDRMASSETCVHRAVYKGTSAHAIIHTHSPYAVALSLIEKEILKPIDSEGLIFMGTVPIVSGRFGTEDLAGNVSAALRTSKACIARGHGVFVAGENLDEAYTLACMVEHSSQVLYLVKAYQRSAEQ